MSDLRFLPQTLTMHRSLMEHAGRFKLTVLCMDDRSEAFLRRRQLAHTALVTVAELQEADPALALTRSQRSWTEYCWTATPAFCRHALERAAPDAVLAWVDSDVEFRRDPNELLRELGDGSVLVTPHEYRRAYPAAAPADLLTQRYGRFNGGTIAFRRDAAGLAAARLWRERTLAWCHDRCEPGRFGNQLHLDDFPQRFARARILAVPGGVLGPWNGGGFQVRDGVDGPTADGHPVIAYHFQSLRLRLADAGVRVPSANVFRLPATPLPIEARVEPHYRLSHSERRIFWHPHLPRLAQAVAEVLEGEPDSLRTMLPKATPAQRLGALGKYVGLHASRIPRPSLNLVSDRVNG
jgi:hypothetical protein